MDRFRGYIAGLGTSSGTRLVVGHWLESPLGAFTDVMAEDDAGVRTLLAPSDAVAQYVGETYRFDRTVVAPVDSVLSREALRVAAGPLRLEALLGPVTLLGRVLEHVPAPLAIAPWWLKLVNPVAGLLDLRVAGGASSTASGPCARWRVQLRRGTARTWAGCVRSNRR